MIQKKFHWFDGWWKEVAQTLDRRPSALLLHGPKGIGKTDFSLEIAAALLCQSPLSDDQTACGKCQSCNWMASRQHPDFRWVRPDADAEEEGWTATGSDGALTVTGGESLQATSSSLRGEAEAIQPSEKKSQEIRIEQIRGLAGFANVGAHRGGLRVVVVSPANRMNYAAANALLKTLEEPSPGLMFILVADSLRGIPATILSRCRRLDLDVSPQDLALL
ncbi:MAG: DNA polymerase III subunit delta', partial [Burkholderiaceae bacterium]|nr:DNA polymerase III subunit delta' [Burkholderiaceae bacterium]